MTKIVSSLPKEKGIPKPCYKCISKRCAVPLEERPTPYPMQDLGHIPEWRRVAKLPHSFQAMPKPCYKCNSRRCAMLLEEQPSRVQQQDRAGTLSEAWCCNIGIARSEDKTLHSLTI